jgi:hypothetical protein
MQYGTKLHTETSQPITAESINKALSEAYIRRRSCENWDGPTHFFNTRAARLRSFDDNWPHTKYLNLSPAVLAEAGFFTPMSDIIKVGLTTLLYMMLLKWD